MQTADVEKEKQTNLHPQN